MPTCSAQGTVSQWETCCRRRGPRPRRQPRLRSSPQNQSCPGRTPSQRQRYAESRIKASKQLSENVCFFHCYTPSNIQHVGSQFTPAVPDLQALPFLWLPVGTPIALGWESHAIKWLLIYSFHLTVLTQKSPGIFARFICDAIRQLKSQPMLPGWQTAQKDPKGLWGENGTEEQKLREGHVPVAVKAVWFSSVSLSRVWSHSNPPHHFYISTFLPRFGSKIENGKGYFMLFFHYV